jgi:hypothetical protein
LGWVTVQGACRVRWREALPGLEGLDHAFEGFLGGREVVEQGAGDDQVIGFRFDCIVEDVNAADL